ncbi:MAG: hypothetical protein R3C49_15545 [Planctomycetaceae bacterium]
MDRRILPFVLLLSVAEPVLGQNAEVPAELRERVVSFESSVAQAEARFAKALLESQESLLTELRRIQDRLTMEVRLDDAVVVRDFLKAVREKVDLTQRRAFITSRVQELPTEVREAVAGYLRASTDAEREHRKALAERTKQQVESLSAEFRVFTESGNLEAALFIRNALLKLGEDPARATAVSPGTPEFSGDPAQVRNEYQQWLQQIMQTQEQHFAPLIEKAEVDLRHRLEVETRAANLDEAVRIRDLLRRLDSVPAEAPPSVRVQLLRRPDPGFSVDVVELLKRLENETKEIETEIHRLRATGDLAFAAANKPEFDRSILTGNDVQRRQVLAEYYHLTRQLEKLHAMHQRRSTAPANPQAVEIIRSVSEDVVRMTDRTRKQELEFRAALIDRLSKVEAAELTAEEQGAVRKALEFARADYSQGLLAMLLFQRPPELPQSARDALDQYRHGVASIRTSAVEETAAIRGKLQEQLQPLVEQHVRNSEYAEATELLDHNWLPEPPQATVPVKASRTPSSDHLWDAQVLDIRGENSLLVTFGLPQTEWLPRNRVRFQHDDPIKVTPRSGSSSPNPPGIPVTEETRLRVGLKAFKYWGTRWYPVTIEGISPQNVTISWDDWGRSQETCNREDLSLFEDQEPDGD